MSQRKTKANPARGRRESRRPAGRQSEAEQTLQALRAGLIDALVITQGPRDRLYALRTFEELEESNTRLQASQERLLLLLNDHERLMQDLHDGCIQSIYAVGLALEDCRTLIGNDPAQAARCVAQAEANLNLVIQELRGFISGASAPPVDLAQDIARIVDGLGSRGPRFRLDIDRAAAQSVPGEQAEQLLHIAREAVSNILRHAEAKSARVALRQRGNKVRLEISDDGRGFEASAGNNSGLGLHHISARVRKIGGRLQLRARPSAGCRIVVELAV